MAGEGLFFAGTVLKNNRDLIKEDMAREELKLKKEQLELQKQDAANKRKDARNKGQKANIKNYSLEGVNPLFVPDLQSNVANYQDFANNNSMSIYDGNIDLKNEQASLERGVSSLSNNYVSLSSDITVLDNLVNNNKGGQLKLAENGEYLYVHNMNMIKEATQGENAISMSEALDLYPVDSQSMINKTEWADPTNLLLEADNTARKGQFDGTDGYKYSSISDDQKNQTKQKISNSLKVNSNGVHNDTDYLRVYNTREVIARGAKMQAKNAFFLESYVDPETGQVGGISSVSADLLNQLDPENKKTFNKELSDSYADYLTNKITEEGYQNMGPERAGKVVGDTAAEKKIKEAEQAQLESNTNKARIISTSKTGDEALTGYQTYYGHPELSEDLTKGIKTDSPLSAILNPNSKEATAFKVVAENIMDGATTMEFDVINITLDGHGLPVALIQIPSFPNSKAFIPYSRLSSKTIESLGTDVQELVNYKKPEVKFDPNSHSND